MARNGYPSGAKRPDPEKLDARGRAVRLNQRGANGLPRSQPQSEARPTSGEGYLLGGVGRDIIIGFPGFSEALDVLGVESRRRLSGDIGGGGAGPTPEPWEPTSPGFPLDASGNGWQMPDGTFTLADTPYASLFGLTPNMLQPAGGEGAGGGALPAPVPPIRPDERKSRFPYGPAPSGAKRDLGKPIELPDPPPNPVGPGLGEDPAKVAPGKSGPSLPTKKGNEEDIVEPDPDEPRGVRFKAKYRGESKPHQDALKKAKEEGTEPRDVSLGTADDCTASQFAYLANLFEMEMLYKDYAYRLPNGLTEAEAKALAVKQADLTCDQVWASTLQHLGLYTPPDEVTPERGSEAGLALEAQLKAAIAKQFNDGASVPTAVDQAWQQSLSYWLSENGYNCQAPCKRKVETLYLNIEVDVTDLYFESEHSVTEFPPYYTYGEAASGGTQEEQDRIELDKQNSEYGWVICSLRYKLSVVWDWAGYVICYVP